MSADREDRRPAPTPVSEILARARRGVRRVRPDEVEQRLAAGAWVLDLRTPWTRDAEGHLPGAVVVEHTVLLWRMDPQSPHRLPDGPGYDDELIAMCNEGFQSSLAARDLRELGFSRATDLEGGFRAWAASGGTTSSAPTRYVT